MFIFQSITVNIMEKIRKFEKGPNKVKKKTVKQIKENRFQIFS